MINPAGGLEKTLKCIHCGQDIGSFFFRTIHREDGGEEYIHKDPLKNKDCFTASGRKDNFMLDEYLQMAVAYMSR
ncbi:MAG TPA: hypothetical protein VMV71_02595 [Candidatus Paceibacterota bacterium]|nr:hypothetical protein [Candidatus Paceibacterota bacterium]